MAEKTLSVAESPWSDDAALLLSRAIHDPLVGIESLRKIVAAGCGTLFEAHCDGALIGAYVLQVNQCDHGRELVVLACGGNLHGVSLLSTFVPYIEGQAGRCNRVRISTSRAGMVHRLARMGYSVMDVGCVKDLQ